LNGAQLEADLPRGLGVKDEALDELIQVAIENTLQHVETEVETVIGDA